MDMLVVEHANDAQIEEAVLEELAPDTDLVLGVPRAGPSRNQCPLGVLEEEKSKEYDEEYESRSRRRQMNGTEELKVAHTVTYNEEAMLCGANVAGATPRRPRDDDVPIDEICPSPRVAQGSASKGLNAAPHYALSNLS